MAAGKTTMMRVRGSAVPDRVSVGAATFALRATLGGEPDKLAGGIGFGPRLLISEAGLRATGLVQPGRYLGTASASTAPPAALAQASAPDTDTGNRLVPYRFFGGLPCLRW